jgi:ubiquinone/menaquinone biosynthesis C-methylase UbiE
VTDSEALRYYDQAQLWGHDELSAMERERVAATLSAIPSGVEAVLDVGCGDGRLTNRLAVRHERVVGVDISPEALRHVEVETHVAPVTALPFADRSFDLVIAINVVHNLPLDACREAIREMERVGRGGKYLQVDSWLTEEQRVNFERWQLTALTYFDPDGWRGLLAEAGYTGEYYWTVTE